MDPQYVLCHPSGAKHLDAAPSFGGKFVYPRFKVKLTAWYKISSGTWLTLYRPRNSSNFTELLIVQYCFHKRLTVYPFLSQLNPVPFHKPYFLNTFTFAVTFAPGPCRLLLKTKKIPRWTYVDLCIYYPSSSSYVPSCHTLIDFITIALADDIHKWQNSKFSQFCRHFLYYQVFLIIQLMHNQIALKEC